MRTLWLACLLGCLAACAGEHRFGDQRLPALAATSLAPTGGLLMAWEDWGPSELTPLSVSWTCQAEGVWGKVLRSQPTSVPMLP